MARLTRSPSACRGLVSQDRCAIQGRRNSRRQDIPRAGPGISARVSGPYTRRTQQSATPSCARREALSRRGPGLSSGVRATDIGQAYVEDSFQLTVGDSALQGPGGGGGGESGGGNLFGGGEWIEPDWSMICEPGQPCPSGPGPTISKANSQSRPKCVKCDELAALGLPPSFSEFANYGGDNNPHPIIALDFQIPANAAVPETLSAQLTLGGLSSATTVYDLTDVDPGDTIRIALQLDATSLATGNYAYSVAIHMEYSGGAYSNGTFTGQHQIFNWSNSVFGNRWWMPELDRLFVNEDGAALLQGDSVGLWFEADGSGGFNRPEGNFTQLDKLPTGWFVATTPTGEKALFDTTGLLRIREDSNGNARTYAYYDVAEDDFADEPAFITDTFGRTTNFQYNDDGRVESITDFAGRTTSFKYDGNRLDEIIEPDPDGSGPLLAPVTKFDHTSAGRISSVFDPEGNEYTYTYNFAGRLEGGTNPDGGAWSVDPQIMRGLANPAESEGTTSNPLPAVLSEEATGTYTDARTFITTSRYDRFAQPIERVDALGNVYAWERDDDGLPRNGRCPIPIMSAASRMAHSTNLSLQASAIHAATRPKWCTPMARRNIGRTKALSIV